MNSTLAAACSLSDCDQKNSKDWVGYTNTSRFSALLLWQLSKPHAVFFEELNARGLQSGSKRRFVRGSHGNFPLNSFYPTIAATPTFETWADRERSTVDEAIPADPKSRILDRRSSPQ